jgi:hypothetical protein
MKNLLIVTFVFALVSTLNYLYVKDKVNARVIELERKLGDEIVLGKDTLIIIDYSIMTNTYTLSNGYKINKSVLE